MKILGIVVLCIIICIIALVAVLMVKNYFDSKTPLLPDDYYTGFKSDSEREKKYSGKGDFTVSSVTYKSDNKSIGNFRIWYPSEMENGTKTYPLIVVANGSNTPALIYQPYFERLASWGFVVIGNDDKQTGTGDTTSETLNYMLSLNKDTNSIFCGRIDEDKIGIAGYSQGGAAAIRAVTEFENSNKYKAIFTGSASYALLARNMGWEYDISKVTIPYFMTGGTGASDDSGKYGDNEFAGVAPLFSLKDNYNGMPGDVEKIRARVTGAEHFEMQLRTDGYMTAWMLYHLYEDEEAAKVFVGDEAEILNNANWQDIEKNK